LRSGISNKNTVACLKVKNWVGYATELQNSLVHWKEKALYYL